MSLISFLLGNVSGPGAHGDDSFHLPGSLSPLSAMSPLSGAHSPAQYPPASPAPSAEAHSPYPHPLELHSSGGTSPATYSPNVISSSPQGDAQPRSPMDDRLPGAPAQGGMLRGRQTVPKFRNVPNVITNFNHEIQHPPQGHIMSAGVYSHRTPFPSPIATNPKRGDTPETRFDRKRNRGRSVGSSSQPSHSRGLSGPDISYMQGRFGATSVGNSRVTSPYARPQDLMSRSEASM